MADRMDLAKLVREIVADATGELRVCMPARIVEYDADTHFASVQPLLMRKFYNAAQAEPLPVIHNVPVVHPRTAAAILRLPVAVGDIVTLMFSDRSLEQWLSGDGKLTDPQDARQHNITDAYALLGGYPLGKERTSDNPHALEIGVTPGTKITIGNGQDELITLAHAAFLQLKDVCDNLSSTLQNLTLLTVTGVLSGGATSGPPVNAPIFATLKTAVDNISTQVQDTADSLGNIKT